MYTDHTYLYNLKLLPNQNAEIEIKIMEHHREHMYVTIVLNVTPECLYQIRD